MSFIQFFLSFSRSSKPTKNRKRRPAARLVPHLEPLEDRTVPSGAAISGFVYNDLNNSGLMTSGDPGIANNAIQLWSGGRLIASTVTDQNGFYSFSVNPTISTAPMTKTYQASFPQTATDWTASQTVPQFDPSLGTLQSVEIANASEMTTDVKVENVASSAATIQPIVTGTITLTGPGVSGLTTSLSKSNTFDASAYDGTINFSGTSGHDFGDQTAAGNQSTTLSTPADLALFEGTGTVSFTEATQSSSSATGSANLIVSVNTTASAQVTVVYNYIPSNALTPGTYIIVQPSNPAGYFPGLVTAGNITPIPNSQTNHVIQVTLTNSGSSNNDFAELKPSSIQGYVYYDARDNGVKALIDPGIGGVSLTLTGSNDLGQAVSAAQTTAADGSYSFAGLRPGTYTVTETQPAGYFAGKATAGNLGGGVGADVLSNIQLPPSSGGVNYNFGNLLPASLSGYVYYDAPDQGVRQTSDPGIAGVTITLTGVDDHGNAVNATQTTAADGSYTFGNLRPGTYTITETPPAGYSDGTDTIGNQGGTVGIHQFTHVFMASGWVGVNNDFGHLLPATLKGFVYIDSNDDGTKDPGDAGIEGATVTLTGVDDHGNAVNVTTLTGADGSYTFSPLRPGTYSITKTDPAGYLEGRSSVGNQGGVIASPDQLTSLPLHSGWYGVNNNFGEVVPAGLSGYVYLDAKRDGTKDPGDAGIYQVLITLTGHNDLGQSINVTQLTGADGSYNFGNLRPGQYVITKTPPAGFLEGAASIGTQGGVVGTDQLSINLNAGVAGTNNNFGELLPLPPPPPPPPATPSLTQAPTPTPVTTPTAPPPSEPGLSKIWFLSSFGFGETL